MDNIKKLGRGNVKRKEGVICMIFKKIMGSVLVSTLVFNGISIARAEAQNTLNYKSAPQFATLATTSYKVVAGDSLYTLAKRFGITVTSLKSANGLTSDAIYIGQVLSIPSSTSTTAFVTLSTGSSGSNVSTLQTNLKALGYYTYSQITGYFGSVTRQAVASFQTAYSLPATGVVNSATNTQIWHALVKKRMVTDSKKYTSVPYKWGGQTPSGFDCSGFVYYMFNYEGVKFPRTTSEEIYAMGTGIDTAHLRPGDLVFFGVNKPGVISHVGFYIGNNQFISATSSKGIWTYPVTTGYWAQYYIGAKRVY